MKLGNTIQPPVQSHNKGYGCMTLINGESKELRTFSNLPQSYSKSPEKGKPRKRDDICELLSILARSVGGKGLRTVRSDTLPNKSLILKILWGPRGNQERSLQDFF